MRIPSRGFAKTIGNLPYCQDFSSGVHGVLLSGTISEEAIAKFYLLTKRARRIFIRSKYIVIVLLIDAHFPVQIGAQTVWASPFWRGNYISIFSMRI
jgi:hypothetical protein